MKETKPKRIVLVDDDPALLDVMEMILTPEGYLVESMRCGLPLLDGCPDLPDLVLLDIHLGGGSQPGDEICRRLKQRDNAKKTNVVLISADERLVEIANAAGADGYLSKPFNISELIQKIYGVFDV